MDGKAGPPEYEDNAGLVLSRDGRRVAYAAKKGQRWIVVVDGKADDLDFDHIFLGRARLTFDADGTLAYLAAKNGTLYRVWHDPLRQ